MSGRRFFTLLLALLLFLPIIAEAQQPKKSKRVQQLERERQKTLKDIEKTGIELKSTQRSAADAKKRIRLLETQVVQRSKLVALLGTEVSTLNFEIDSMGRICRRLEGEEGRSRDTYARVLQAMQRRPSSTDRLLFLFSARSFDEGMRRTAYLTQYGKAHKEAAAALKNARTAVEAQRAAIALHRTEKQSLMTRREREKLNLEREESAKRDEMTRLNAKTRQLKQQLSKQQAAARALDNKIEQQIAYEIAEAERKAAEERRRAEEAARKAGKPAPKREERRAETKGGYAMDAAERALSGSFAANRGRLPAPVRGRYSVASPFGSSAHSENSRVTMNNSGIDLAVSAGTDASAVFDGVVTAVFVQPGYNTAVIVRHGNYLTVYANLSSVYVHKGQRVKTGQAIGKIFTESSSGKTLLHFELWKERSRQNPAAWIR